MDTLFDRCKKAQESDWWPMLGTRDKGIIDHHVHSYWNESQDADLSPESWEQALPPYVAPYVSNALRQMENLERQMERQTSHEAPKGYVGRSSISHRRVANLDAKPKAKAKKK